MKTKLLLPALLLCGILNAQTYSFATATPIPDGVTAASGCGNGTTAGSVVTTLNVPITGTITDPTKVTINLDLTHVWLGDVVAQLGTPGGTSCALIKRAGAAADDACGDSSDFGAGNILSFNAANTTPMNVTTPGGAASIPGGSYAPTGGTSTFPSAIPLCNLSTFLNGVAVNGNWTMTFYDHGNGDTGTVNGWQLIFTTGFNLSAQDFIFMKKISVLGNPFSEQLTLKMNESSNSTIFHIYSIDGKEVFKRDYSNADPSQNIAIETSSWQKGIYLLVPEIDGKRLNAIKIAKN